MRRVELPSRDEHALAPGSGKVAHGKRLHHRSTRADNAAAYPIPAPKRNLFAPAAIA